MIQKGRFRRTSLPEVWREYFNVLQNLDIQRNSSQKSVTVVWGFFLSYKEEILSALWGKNNWKITSCKNTYFAFSFVKIEAVKTLDSLTSGGWSKTKYPLQGALPSSLLKLLFLFFWLSGMQDLSSWPRDQTCPLQWECRVLTTGQPVKGSPRSPHFLLFFTNIEGEWKLCLLGHLCCVILCDRVQIRSVAQLCPTLCDPMNRSTPGLPVHHQLPEFTQTHDHRVSDAIQPSHPLSSASPLAPNPSQHYSAI